jgi:hypothetical protein
MGNEFVGKHFNLIDIFKNPFIRLEFFGYLAATVGYFFLGFPQLMPLLFPLVTGAFALMFGALHIGKEQTVLPNISISLNPLGNERDHHRILIISAIIQFVVVFLSGIDSRVHPQLIEETGVLFVIPLLIIYSGTFLWIPLDLLRRSKLTFINIERIRSNDDNNHKPRPIVFSKPSVQKIRLIMITVTVLISVTLGLVIIDSILISLDAPHLWNFGLMLPGSLTEYQEVVFISGTIWILMVIAPASILFIIFQVLSQIFSPSKDIAIKIEEKAGSMTSDQIKMLERSIELL